MPRITGDKHYVRHEFTLGPDGTTSYEAVCTMPGCGFRQPLSSGDEQEYRRVAAEHEATVLSGSDLS